jgi:hypothetical protein
LVGWRSIEKTRENYKALEEIDTPTTFQMALSRRIARVANQYLRRLDGHPGWPQPAVSKS